MGAGMIDGRVIFNYMHKFRDETKERKGICT
jgi:hypothetical protein